MKKALYVGVIVDPLNNFDITDRCKIGITQDESTLLSRERGLTRDAGTKMGMDYVIVSAWEFEEEIASDWESLLHDVFKTYRGEWVAEEAANVISVIRRMFSLAKINVEEVDLDHDASATEKAVINNTRDQRGKYDIIVKDLIKEGIFEEGETLRISHQGKTADYKVYSSSLEPSIRSAARSANDIIGKPQWASTIFSNTTVVRTGKDLWEDYFKNRK